MVDTFNASRPVLLTYLGLSESEILYSPPFISGRPPDDAAHLRLDIGSDRSALARRGWHLVDDGFLLRRAGHSGNAGLGVFDHRALDRPRFILLARCKTLRGRDILEGKETTPRRFFFMAGQMGHFTGPIHHRP